MVEDIGQESYVSVLDSQGHMMYGYKEGYPLNSLWGYQYEGVFKTEQELIDNQASKEHVSTVMYSGKNKDTMLGRPKYKDVDNDGMLTEKDLVWLGSSDPLLFGGLQKTFDIYGLKLGVYFAYSIGGKIYNYSELAMAGAYSTNQYRYMVDSWHPVRNPDSDLPRAGSVERHVPSSLQVHDASYLRLKTLSLSYKFDMSKKKKSVLRDITLGVTGENLFLLSAYNGFDPDVSTNTDTSLPLRRVDMGAYPRARTVVFTLQIRY
jgi:hypothetical protein